MSTNMNQLIFISHSSIDEGIASELCEYLEQNGKKCFIAPRDIRYGKEYAEEIVNGIDSSAAMVLLLSEDANNSPHVLREVERAVTKSIPIIIHKLGEVQLSKSMEYFLMTHQWMNIENDSSFSRILQGIDDILQEKTAPSGTLEEEKKKTTKPKRKDTITEELRLIEAVKTRNRALVKLLLNKFTGNINRKDAEGKSVLFYACEDGNLSMAELLLQREADIDVMDNEGNTLLHAAVKSKNKTMIKMLLEKGLYIDTKNNKGRTALMLAAMNNSADIARFLLEQGADKEIRDDSENNAFRYAVTGGNRQLISMLMGDMATEKTEHGNNVLHTAVIAGSLESVKEVISENPQLVNETNDDGATPIFIAAAKNQYVIMKELVEAGADINRFDNNSRTLLHIAALLNNLACVKLLVEADADLNALDADGNTPLLLAVKHKNAESAYYLVENEADIEVMDNNGKTVYDYAIENKMTELVELLV